MGSPNHNIREFLRYYCSLEEEPGYAVLLKGQWGIGKTWFINETLELLFNKPRYLYVSLYGMTSFDQIEDEFFKQLHPKLSSKSMSLAGKIAKGLLKATIKVDLDDDGKTDGSISAGIPDIDFPAYLTDTEGFVIIFDDLERASISLESLLGYINHYVEHQGYKVIIVANEEEIIERQKNSDDANFFYPRIKEKLIGKTFEIEPDSRGALDSFISTIHCEYTKKIYEKKIDSILTLYNESNYQNLRHLKQALWDFERFVTFINTDAKEKDGVLEGLLKIFLILSFEIKSGEMLPKDIIDFQSKYLRVFINKDSTKNQDCIYNKIRERYKALGFNDLLIDDSIWSEFLEKGYCSKEHLQQSLEASIYYIDASVPSWRKLWDFSELNDDEFDYVRNSVLQDFRTMKFDEVGVLKHVVGILLFLSDVKLIDECKEAVLKQAFLCVDHLKEKGFLAAEASDKDNFNRGSGWSRLGFHSKDSDEFKRLIDYIKQSTEEALIDIYPAVGDELLDLITNDPDLFYQKIVVTNNSVSVYHNIPIFKYIDAIRFVEVISNADIYSKQQVSKVFSERYNFNNFNEILISELDWLKEVVLLSEEEIKRRAGKISGYQLEICVEKYFRPAIAKLIQ